MKKIKKTASRRGETFIELLVSILIIALSAALLFGMYQASGNINRAAQQMDDNLYQAVTEAGNQTGEPQKGKVSFEIKDMTSADGLIPGGADGGNSGEIDVHIYSNDAVTTYSKTAP